MTVLGVDEINESEDDTVGVADCEKCWNGKIPAALVGPFAPAVESKPIAAAVAVGDMDAAGMFTDCCEDIKKAG